MYPRTHGLIFLMGRWRQAMDWVINDMEKASSLDPWWTLWDYASSVLPGTTMSGWNAAGWVTNDDLCNWIQSLDQYNHNLNLCRRRMLTGKIPNPDYYLPFSSDIRISWSCMQNFWMIYESMHASRPPGRADIMDIVEFCTYWIPPIIVETRLIASPSVWLFLS